MTRPSDDTLRRGALVVLPGVGRRLLSKAAVRLSAEKYPAETRAIHLALLRPLDAELERQSIARRAPEKWRKAA